MTINDDKIVTETAKHCKAYKPWIRVSNRDGSLQKACRECSLLGNCEWTGDAEVAMAKESK